jgi:hypothetical protein
MSSSGFTIEVYARDTATAFSRLLVLLSEGLDPDRKDLARHVEARGFRPALRVGSDIGFDYLEFARVRRREMSCENPVEYLYLGKREMTDDRIYLFYGPFCQGTPAPINGYI